MPVRARGREAFYTESIGSPFGPAVVWISAGLIGVAGVVTYREFNTPERKAARQQEQHERRNQQRELRLEAAKARTAQAQAQAQTQVHGDWISPSYIDLGYAEEAPSYHHAPAASFAPRSTVSYTGLPVPHTPHESAAGADTPRSASGFMPHEEEYIDAIKRHAEELQHGKAAVAPHPTSLGIYEEGPAPNEAQAAVAASKAMAASAEPISPPAPVPEPASPPKPAKEGAIPGSAVTEAGPIDIHAAEAGARRRRTLSAAEREVEERTSRQAAHSGIAAPLSGAEFARMQEEARRSEATADERAAAQEAARLAEVQRRTQENRDRERLNREHGRPYTPLPPLETEPPSVRVNMSLSGEAPTISGAPLRTPPRTEVHPRSVLATAPTPAPAATTELAREAGADVRRLTREAAASEQRVRELQERGASGKEVRHAIQVANTTAADLEAARADSRRLRRQARAETTPGQRAEAAKERMREKIRQGRPPEEVRRAAIRAQEAEIAAGGPVAVVAATELQPTAREGPRRQMLPRQQAPQRQPAMTGQHRPIVTGAPGRAPQRGVAPGMTAEQGARLSAAANRIFGPANPAASAASNARIAADVPRREAEAGRGSGGQRHRGQPMPSAHATEEGRISGESVATQRRQVLELLDAARHAEDLATKAPNRDNNSRAKAARAAADAALQALDQMGALGYLPSPRTHVTRPGPGVLLDYVLPSSVQFSDVTDIRPDPGLFMRRIESALGKERAITFDVVPPGLLGLDVEIGRDKRGYVEGHVSSWADAAYNPCTNRIAQTPAMTYPTVHGLQTIIHEGTHGLLHGPGCSVMGDRVCKDALSDLERAYSESEAEIATMATMAALNQPLEVGVGGSGFRMVAQPGTYQIDYTKVRNDMGPAAEARIQWAVDWMTTAAQGGDPTGTCPPPPDVLRVHPDFEIDDTVRQRYTTVGRGESPQNS